MKVSCPHCSQHLELDPETLIALEGASHFDCLTCGGAVEVPIPVLVPAKQTGPGQAGKPTPERVARQTQQGMTRNLFVLGILALLAIGGVALFLASKSGGNVFNSFQNITNQIINNSYFTQLIADGVTTKEDLQEIAEIRPYGDGFIGVSKAALDWDQAQDLAKRTGAEVLAAEDSAAAPRQKLLAWLVDIFSSHLLSPVWIREHEIASILDGTEILAVTAMDRQRKALLQWPLNPDPNIPARWKNAIDLLSLISLPQDALSGEWRRVGSELVSTSGVPAKIQIPYEPPREYDVRMVFTCKAGFRQVSHMLTHAGKSFGFIMGAQKGSMMGLEIIAGKDVSKNPTLTMVAMQTGRRYTSIVQVRSDGIKAFLDSELVAEWKTDYYDMSMVENWALRDDNHLGFGSYKTPTFFHSLEILEVPASTR